MQDCPEPPTSPDPEERDYHPIEERCFCGFPMLGIRPCPNHGYSVRVPDPAKCDHEWREVPGTSDGLAVSRTYRCARGCGSSRVTA
jgi:hypothetical protein